jgi:hypothetical protein
MKIGLLYWILWVLWFVFGAWSGYSMEPTTRRNFWGGSILLLVLLFLLGWQVFGFVIEK